MLPSVQSRSKEAPAAAVEETVPETFAIQLGVNVPVGLVPKLHVHNGIEVAQVAVEFGVELTASAAEALLPVSSVLMNRLPVVLVYTPSVATVTVKLIVQGTPGATERLEAEKEFAPSLTEAGEGVAPQLVYVTV